MNSRAQSKAGIREQHLLRKRHNPLFDASNSDISNEQLARARLEDGVEMDRFLSDFQLLVQKAAQFEPNTPSDTILELKEELDRAYQQACALPGDQEHIKHSIRKLLTVIMQAVRAGGGDDSYARRQLDDEETARQAHFELQELPLVSALTHPDSPIAEDELVPSLLSESVETLAPTLQLFDEDQLACILSDAKTLLERKDPQRTLGNAWQALKLIETLADDRRSRATATD
jgi:hypothetical protein